VLSAVRQSEVIFFATDETLTPEVGREPDPLGADMESDATQFVCHLSHAAAHGGGDALLCRLDGAAPIEIDLRRATDVVDSSDARLACAATDNSQPLPPFFQIEFGPVALRVYPSPDTPAAGRGALSHARAKVLDLYRDAPAEAAADDAERASLGLAAALEVLARAGAASDLVRAAQRVPPTFKLKDLMCELGHAHVDGRSPERLVQEALSATASRRAATVVSLGVKAEAIELLSAGARDAELRLRKRCRALVAQHQAASRVCNGPVGVDAATARAAANDGAAAAARRDEPPADVEAMDEAGYAGGYGILSDCARKIAELEMLPARRSVTTSFAAGDEG
jgi:hypothetical protein